MYIKHTPKETNDEIITKRNIFSLVTENDVRESMFSLNLMQI